jgi:hypothetical protein
MRAVARAFLEKQPNVSHVAVLSRVGRASFYEFFDDFEHALAAVKSLATDGMRRALQTALERERAPVAALRALASEFLGALHSWPEAAFVALSSNGSETSALGRCFAHALERWLESSRSAGLVTHLSDTTRVLLATGAAEAVARRAALAAVNRTARRSEDERQLADALLRLLR